MSKAPRERESAGALLAHRLDMIAERAHRIADDLSWVREPEDRLDVPDVGEVSDLTGRFQDLFSGLARLMSELNAMAPLWEIELEPGRGRLIDALEGRLE